MTSGLIPRAIFFDCKTGSSKDDSVVCHFLQKNRIFWAVFCRGKAPENLDEKALLRYNWNWLDKACFSVTDGTVGKTTREQRGNIYVDRLGSPVS